MVDGAEAEKKAAIANARRDSVSKIQAAEAAAREASESSVSKKKDSLTAERDKLLNAGTEEADELERSAAGRMSEVKDFLNKEFERTLNVTS